MSLLSIFHLSVYGLIGYSAIIFALAEGTQFPPEMCTIPLILVAYLINERKPILRLNAWGANALGLLAFTIAAVEFFSSDIEAKLLSGAHLLVYLTWIVLFQKKTTAQYWWLLALAVLQVAVASVLTYSGWYGLALAFYLLMSVWTLSVFSIYQAVERFAGLQRFAAVTSGGMVAFSSQPIVPNAEGVVLAKKSQRFRSSRPGLPTSMVRWMVQSDPDANLISRQFIVGVVSAFMLVVFVGSLFYLFVPRVWVGRGSLFDPSDSGVTLGARTGFSQEVRLGDIGQILESSRLILQMQVYDNVTGEELDVEELAWDAGFDEPVMRGMVLDTYRKGKWTIRGNRRRLVSVARKPKAPENTIRQEIELEDIGSNSLFVIFPAVACWIDSDEQFIRRDFATHAMFRRKREDSGAGFPRVMYYVHTQYPAWKKGARPSVPASEIDSYPDFMSRYLALPSNLARLEEYAVEVAEINESDSANKPSAADIAGRLEAHLRDSEIFSYTLSAGIDDPSIDPVEDFLFNRKTGHCEYFASALALMMRSVGIPSRVVNGLKGGQLNSMTGRYEVQERHAHSWVEAYLDGRWVMYDATPIAGRSESVAAQAPTISWWHATKHLAENFWKNDVLQLSLDRQNQAFFNPIREYFGSLKEVWESESGSEGPLDVLARWKKWLLPHGWLSGRGLAVTLVLLVILVSVVWAASRLLSKLWHLGSHRRRGGQASRIAFYERFAQLVHRKGLYRAQHVTQREFAEQVNQRLQQLLQQSELSHLADEVTNSFYRVRFAQAELLPEERRKIDQLLGSLEKALTQPHAKTKESIGPAAPLV